MLILFSQYVWEEKTQVNIESDSCWTVQVAVYCNFTNFWCIKILQLVASDHGVFGLVAMPMDTTVITRSHMSHDGFYGKDQSEGRKLVWIE